MTTTFISFQNFASIEDAKNFSAFNAEPEREDGVLGQLPDGTLIFSQIVRDEENMVSWCVAAMHDL